MSALTADSCCSRVKLAAIHPLELGEQLNRAMPHIGENGAMRPTQGCPRRTKMGPSEIIPLQGWTRVLSPTSFCTLS